jgi:hypothetical protein
MHASESSSISLHRCLVASTGRWMLFARRTWASARALEAMRMHTTEARLIVAAHRSLLPCGLRLIAESERERARETTFARRDIARRASHARRESTAWQDRGRHKFESEERSSTKGTVLGYGKMAAWPAIRSHGCQAMLSHDSRRACHPHKPHCCRFTSVPFLTFEYSPAPFDPFILGCTYRADPSLAATHSRTTH